MKKVKKCPNCGHELTKRDVNGCAECAKNWDIIQTWLRQIHDKEAEAK